ncbi:MAG: hypothetical protein RIC55_06385 [Pirellulaceae bacterium]
MANETPRRKRRLLQFSLRTYLVISLVGGLGLWCSMYWLREYWPHLAGTWGPPPTEAALPGGWKARQHLREVTDKDSGQKRSLRTGRYVLVDEHDYTRCIGWFKDDLPEHTWTYYHENGRRAMQGECRQGLRSGLWTAWYDNGRQQWEIEHALPPTKEALAQVVARLNSQGDASSDGGSPDADSPEGESDGDESLGESPDKALLQAAVRWPPLRTAFTGKFTGTPDIVAVRHGAARTWWSNGHPQSRGSFQNDQRHGTWTFWDEQGRRVEQGDYEQGARHGPWQEWDAEQRESTVHYARGVRVENVEQLSTRLREAIDAGEVTRALEVVQLYGGLGGEYADRLAPAIGSDQVEIAKAALRAAIPMGEDAEPLLKLLQQAENRHSGRMRTMAIIAQIAAGASNGPQLMSRLLRDVPRNVHDYSFYPFVECLLDAGPGIIEVLEVQLASDDAKIRHRAVEVMGTMLFYSSAAGEPNREAVAVAAVSALRRAANHDDQKVARRAREILQVAPFWQGPPQGPPMPYRIPVVG